jgi:hypothetical protein
MSAEDKQALLDRLQHQRDEIHGAKVLAYELSWRLRNLGLLPNSTWLAFPVEGAAREALLDALRRYARKNKLPPPEMNDLLTGDTSDAMKTVADAIKKEHDG